jgi:hypothetical protein
MEEWKNIDGHPYMVSNHGRIFSPRTGKIISLTLNNGYRGFVSYNKGIEKFLYVHRCVLTAFKPNDNMDTMSVNHIDFNRNNNHIDNLEWTTDLENQRHSIKHGRYLRANKSHSEWMKKNTSFINTRKPVLLINQCAIIECESATEAAAIVGVTVSTMANATRKNLTIRGYNPYYL